MNNTKSSRAELRDKWLGEWLLGSPDWEKHCREWMELERSATDKASDELVDIGGVPAIK